MGVIEDHRITTRVSRRETDASSVIVDNLDIWTSAIKNKSSAGRGGGSKRELYGVKKLRELILELAVQGLLVPQNPDDEPTSKLLKKINAEKAKLIKEGKIKKTKLLSSISDEEKTFCLPSNWQYVRLGQLFNSIDSGGTPSKRNPDYWGGEIPWASVKDLGTQRYISKTQDYITKTGLENGSRLADIDDVLICTRMGLGKISIVKEPMAFNQDLKAVKLTSQCNVDFFLNTYSTLKIKGTGTTVKGIKQEQLLDYVVGLPPSEEQHRIVAKVDELMALCDQLEQQTEASLTAHETLVEALLGALTNTADHNNFQQAWQRIAQHFDTLFTTEQSIDQLKQTILQLAVMGKLVPQDPNDEPASELLKKIATEKSRLVKEGKIKKQKRLPPIGDEGKLFELPSSWEYRRLGELSYVFSGNSFKSGDFNELGGTRVIKITNAGVGKVIQTEDFLPEDFLDKYPQYKVYKGDLVLALTRPYISTGLKISICPEEYDQSLLNQRVAAIRTQVDGLFLYLFMQSNFVLGLYKKRFGGTGLQPNLKMNDVTELVIPVPPEGEQLRIVTKVEELMTLCDTLKARLNEAQTTQLYLADAVSEQALA